MTEPHELVRLVVEGDLLAQVKLVRWLRRLSLIAALGAFAQAAEPTLIRTLQAGCALIEHRGWVAEDSARSSVCRRIPR